MTEQRYCLCGKPIIRRPGEQLSNFRRRQTCGNGTPCHHKAVSKAIREARKSPATIDWITLPPERVAELIAAGEITPIEQITSFWDDEGFKWGT